MHSSIGNQVSNVVICIKNVGIYLHFYNNFDSGGPITNRLIPLTCGFIAISLSMLFNSTSNLTAACISWCHISMQWLAILNSTKFVHINVLHYITSLIHYIIGNALVVDTIHYFIQVCTVMCSVLCAIYALTMNMHSLKCVTTCKYDLKQPQTQIRAQNYTRQPVLIKDKWYALL